MFIEDVVSNSPPKRIKDQESGAYNPVWVDCSVPGAAFTPLSNAPADNGKTTFRYIWIVTDDGKTPPVRGAYRLILGIEFDDVPTLRRVLTHYGFDAWLDKHGDAELKPLLDMGHPTISARFAQKDLLGLDKAAPPPEYGRAFFGGELNGTKAGWEINNHSGRHSSGQTRKTMDGTVVQLARGDWSQLMQKAAELFEQQMRLKVAIGDVKVAAST